MQQRAASLAAELKQRLGIEEITVEEGQQKSEFAVYIDGVQVFSRLEQGRFPEAEEFLERLGGR